jgi:deoxyribose-phosphate aldolase
MADAAASATRALRLLDLTDLNDGCREDHIEALVGRALTPHGPVAAVCVWPQFVSLCRSRLRERPVRIATVVNFPHGGTDVERAVFDAREALKDGADEIDVVLPYAAFMAGDIRVAKDMVAALREEVVGRGRLKVILETGALGTPDLIRRASVLAVEGGADFIKTSTGKIATSATLAACEVMLEVIRDSGRPVGLKPSGGIRTLADAEGYLALADRIMGPGWATPATFRFGASGLYDALLAAITGEGAAAGKAGY